MLTERATQLSLPHGHVGVLRFDLDSDVLLSSVAVEKCLTATEIQRAEKFRFRVHKDRFRRGRAVLRAVLAELTDARDPAAMDIDFGSYGKPMLTGDEIEFNLSHSEEKAVLVWSRQAQVGVDIECHDREVDIAKLAPTVFTEAEQAVLNAAPDQARRALFFSFWTAKEARMKVTGHGMSLAPRDIHLKLQDDLPVGFLHPTEPDISLNFIKSELSLSCAITTLRK